MGEVCLAFPSVRFFWKDENLAYLGMSANLARQLGFASVDSCVGLTDTSEQLPWSRQAAKYQRDDRQVMATGLPVFDIVERQDDGAGTTSWLRTSKSPIRVGDRVVGIFGGFNVISAEEARQLTSRV